MSKKTVVITGSNAGVGFQLALSFARQGDKVIMACRNPGKADAARREILAEVPSADVTIILCDLSDLDSVKNFALEFAKQVGELDILINNAGIVGDSLERNKVGHELQFATNYLGPFALTGLLLPYFRKDGEARIVTVGSLSHRFTKLDFDNINFDDESDYKPMLGYARSKIATMTFTLELERRLRASGSNIVSIGAHPGFAATTITQSQAPKEGTFKFWMQEQTKRIIPAPAAASRPTFYAATSGEVRGGEYYGPAGLFETGLFQKKDTPIHAKINPSANNPDAAKRLWDVSEEMSGVHYLSEQ